MASMHNILKNLNKTSFGEIGSVVCAKHGRWIIGGDGLFPVQIETLAEDDSYMLYSSAIRSTAEPVYVSLMKTMFIENLQGMSLGRYGICFGPVTITIYQKMIADEAFSVEKLAAVMACHRMLVECYLEGGVMLDEDMPPSAMHSMLDGMVMPFRH